MTKYLPKQPYYNKHLDAPNIQIPVKCLEFISAVMEQPLRNFSAIDCLEAIADAKPMFAPGTAYKYVNTNYLLLSLIGDEITGDHTAYLKRIFSNHWALKILTINNHTYLKDLHLPQSYGCAQ